MRIEQVDPSEEGTPPGEPQGSCPHVQVAILVPSEEGTPHTFPSGVQAAGKLRSSSPPRKGRHKPRSTLSPTLSSCDPRPLRGRDATQQAAQDVTTATQLRSSSPPRKGRHPRSTRSGHARSSCDPRPLRGRDATDRPGWADGAGVGCDPRPLRGRDATAAQRAALVAEVLLRSSSPPRKGRHCWVLVEVAAGVVVAILVPSEEGTPQVVSAQPFDAIAVAILVPSEEGTLLDESFGLRESLLLRSSSPPRKGRHRLAWKLSPHLPTLRSSSPPRKGRHCRILVRLVLPDRVAILVPSEEGTPHRTCPTTSPKISCCDPRPLRGRDATCPCQSAPNAL